MKVYLRPAGFSLCPAILLASMAFTPLPAGAEVISDLTATAYGQQVLLEWTVSPGANPLGFQVLRSFDGRVFQTVAQVPVSPGAAKYTYLDGTQFKSEPRIIYYRIRADLPGGASAYSSTAEVALSFSGIQRTWGSIKAMFR